MRGFLSKMGPILYYLELSPPVRAVLLTAKSIDLDLELKNVNLMEGEHKKPKYLKLNPQHTVPTLDDNGFVIWDSHAINAYLIGKYAPDDTFYPTDLKKRAVVDQRLHFDSGILFPRLRNIFFPILFQGRKDIPEENQEAMKEAYAWMDVFLKKSQYLAGSELTIADFSAIASLSSIVPVVTYEPESLPNLTRWMQTMEKLPYYQKANGNGAKGISDRINSLLGK